MNERHHRKLRPHEVARTVRGIVHRGDPALAPCVVRQFPPGMIILTWEFGDRWLRVIHDETGTYVERTERGSTAESHQVLPDNFDVYGRRKDLITLVRDGIDWLLGLPPERRPL